jgi:hypothetical protein
MTPNAHTIPEAIEPFYTMSEPNETIKLFEGNIILEQNGKECLSQSGVIDVIWTLSPNICFHISSVIEFDLSEARLNIPELDMHCEVLITKQLISLNKPTSKIYEGYVKNTTISSFETECDRVIFHVPNFIDFLCGLCRGEAGWLSRGRLHLESDNWRVLLNINRDTRKFIKHLNQTGGFGLTHTGALERTDGSLFSYQEAQDSLKALRLFLSFVRGFWTAPVLMVGEKNGQQVWQQWSLANKLTPWKKVLLWFPYQKPADDGLLITMFHGFMAKKFNPIWEKHFRVAIHWYVEANQQAGGIEASIILIQAALELLAWMYFVQDPSIRMSKNGFKGKSATDKIELLLKHFGIPVSIPDSLKHLAGQEENSGPKIFVKIRNDLVHPERKENLSAHLQSKIEAWLLGLWYLEMSLLFLCGYSDVYYPRFGFDNAWSGEIETKVPWIE